MSPTRGDEGAALIAVMAIGLLIVLAGLGLINGLVSEYRATEDSLMEIRAYWASMGQAAYVLSRTAQSGACNTKIKCPVQPGATNPPDYQPAAQSYLQEITSGKADLHSWIYPDVNVGYTFTLQATVCNDPLAPSSSLGDMLFISSVSGSPACPPAPSGTGAMTPTKCPAPPAPGKGSLPALRAINTIRPVEIRYCLVAPGTTTCGAGSGSPASGAQLITSIHRPSC